MLRRPEDLDADQTLQLKQVLVACPHLDATATHVATFAEMLTGRHGDRLDSWMAAVDAADLPHLHRFVTGLRRDLPGSPQRTHTSPQLGQRRRQRQPHQTIKRQMYGRANFDLLRKRILLAA